MPADGHPAAVSSASDPVGRIEVPASPVEQIPRCTDQRSLRLSQNHLRSRAGSVPGIELSELEKMPSAHGDVYVTCIDYCPTHHQVQKITDLEEFLTHHRPAWSAVRWINVDGLTDMSVIHALAKKYNLHPLAIEDLLNTGQRPKVDPYHAEGDLQARLFISARMVKMQDISITGAGVAVRNEQISIFVGHTTVLTFQETHGDVWDPIRLRLATPASRLRNNDASFLIYALLDTIVDQCFPLLEHYGMRLEELEEIVLANPSPKVIGEIYRIKRELLMVRRAVWPMRDVIHDLQDETHECFSETARTYMRDVHDHLVQIIEVLETYREAAIGLTETYMSVMSNRMNEVMKVLTLIGTIFIPLTFLAGVYGMNFHYMPEMNSRIAYPVFWVACGALAVAMVAWFRHRGWF